VPFWEWLIAEVRSATPTSSSSPRRSRAARDARARQARLHAVLHVLHVEELALGAQEYVDELAAPREPSTSGRTSSSTRRTSSRLPRHGGRRRSSPRLVLAATLSPSYGIYSGYENFENVPRARGREEYLDSRSTRSRSAPRRPLLPLIQRLNQIRRDNPALQRSTTCVPRDRRTTR
jgi:starch synthase (maltosyl-transferring)